MGSLRCFRHINSLIFRGIFCLASHLNPLGMSMLNSGLKNLSQHKKANSYQIWWKQTPTGTTKTKIQHKLNFLPDQRGAKEMFSSFRPTRRIKAKPRVTAATQSPSLHQRALQDTTSLPSPRDPERAKLVPFALLSRQWVSGFWSRRPGGSGALAPSSHTSWPLILQTFPAPVSAALS